MSIANPTEPEKREIERRVAGEIFKEVERVSALVEDRCGSDITGPMQILTAINETATQKLKDHNYGILGGVGVQVAAQLKSIRENFDAETVAVQVASVLNQFQC